MGKRLFNLLTALLMAILALPSLAVAQGQWVQTPPSLQGQYAPGTVIIVYSARKLFLVADQQHSRLYRVAVPKAGRTWFGPAQIASKHVNPDWSPPAVVRAAHPELPDLIPGGSPDNPMGTRALMLDRDQIAIHGTTRRMRGSIGSAASFGCIRMLNEDVEELFAQVDAGTPVMMLETL